MSAASWLASRRRHRADRALARQWAYQERRAREAPDEAIAWMREKTLRVGAELRAAGLPAPCERVLEVGSGSRGLIFFLDLGSLRVGVDPLAAGYARLLPWQRRAATCAAAGESLPFADAAFDVVLCDNVIDHAEGPAAIVRELGRVLRPGGLLYFTVNVHHPVYRLAAGVHAAWATLGLPLEIGPFADHTVHLVADDARRLLAGLPVDVLVEHDGIAAARAAAREIPPRHAGDRLKRLFFKNARYVAIARRRQQAGV